MDLTDRHLSAGSYTLVLATFDDQSGLLPIVDGYAHLPSTLGAMDAAGGFLDGDFGDFVLQITHSGPTFMRGDFNMSGNVDTADIDLLAANDGSSDPKFDLDGNGTAEFKYSPSGLNSDSDILIREIIATEYGDTDLDGRVSLIDLDTLGQHFGGSGGWADADFSGDGDVTLIDLDYLGQQFGFVASASVAAVPEPDFAFVMVFAATAFMVQVRRARVANRLLPT